MKICSIEGCNGEFYAKGLCRRCYRRKRYENPAIRKKFREYYQRRKVYVPNINLVERILIKRIRTNTKRREFLEKLRAGITECEYDRLNNVLKELEKGEINGKKI